MSLSPGQTFAQKYRVIERLGEGGMGAVYVAENLALHMRVALKVMSERFASDPTQVERFLREAPAAAAVRHPGVVQIFDAGVDQEVPWIAMELLEGQSLGARLADAGGRLGPEEAVSLTLGVLSALAALHARGIVHRDLKPDNVFLTRLDDAVQPKILDFGLAKDTNAEEFQRLTATGAVLGTPKYLAPEQLTGAHPVGPATDLYAVGHILYELLAGRAPYRGGSLAQMLVQTMTEEPADLGELCPELPRPLSALVMQCLAKDPAARPESAAALRRELALLGGGGGGLGEGARSPTPPAGVSMAAHAASPHADPAFAETVRDLSKVALPFGLASSAPHNASFIAQEGASSPASVLAPGAAHVSSPATFAPTAMFEATPPPMGTAAAAPVHHVYAPTEQLPETVLRLDAHGSPHGRPPGVERFTEMPAVHLSPAPASPMGPPPMGPPMGPPPMAQLASSPGLSTPSYAFEAGGARMGPGLAIAAGVGVLLAIVAALAAVAVLTHEEDDGERERPTSGVATSDPVAPTTTGPTALAGQLSAGKPVDYPRPLLNLVMGARETQVDLQQCTDAASARGFTRGSAVVRVLLGGEGPVAAEVFSETAPATGLGECLRQRTLAWPWPPFTDDGVAAAYVSVER